MSKENTETIKEEQVKLTEEQVKKEEQVKLTEKIIKEEKQIIDEETLVFELVLLIAKNIGITNLNIDTNPLDNHISFNLKLPWVKNLVNKVLPLYKQLLTDPNINSNEVILSMVKNIDKHVISKDILEIINLQDQNSKLEIEHISDITKLITDMASLYGELSKTDMKKVLTQKNVMLLLTIVLYIILYFVKKDINEKDIKWIEITINCLNFTSILVTEITKSCNFKLFSCIGK